VLSVAGSDLVEEAADHCEELLGPLEHDRVTGPGPVNNSRRASGIAFATICPSVDGVIRSFPPAITSVGAVMLPSRSRVSWARSASSGSV
jgi:hypothetical protein